MYNVCLNIFVVRLNYEIYKGFKGLSARARASEFTDPPVRVRVI